MNIINVPVSDIDFVPINVLATMPINAFTMQSRSGASFTVKAHPSYEEYWTVKEKSGLTLPSSPMDKDYVLCYVKSSIVSDLIEVVGVLINK